MLVRRGGRTTTLTGEEMIGDRRGRDLAARKNKEGIGCDEIELKRRITSILELSKILDMENQELVKNSDLTMIPEMCVIEVTEGQDIDKFPETSLTPEE